MVNHVTHLEEVKKSLELKLEESLNKPSIHDISLADELNDSRIQTAESELLELTNKFKQVQFTEQKQ